MGDHGPSNDRKKNILLNVMENWISHDQLVSMNSYQSIDHRKNMKKHEQNTVMLEDLCVNAWHCLRRCHGRGTKQTKNEGISWLGKTCYTMLINMHAFWVMLDPFGYMTKLFFKTLPKSQKTADSHIPGHGGINLIANEWHQPFRKVWQISR